MGRKSIPVLTRYVEDKRGCFVWQGPVNRKGYGAATSRLAHRVVYEQVNGRVPDGMEVHHECGNRRCINPAHLRAVTHRANVALSKTGFCRSGRHPFEAPQEPGRYNGCLLCHAERERNRRARLPKPPPRGIKSHCKRGHPRIEENLYRLGSYVDCRICRKQRQQRK